jgi:hypothetical protein
LNKHFNFNSACNDDTSLRLQLTHVTVGQALSSAIISRWKSGFLTTGIFHVRDSTGRSPCKGYNDRNHNSFRLIDVARFRAHLLKVLNVLVSLSLSHLLVESASQIGLYQDHLVH